MANRTEDRERRRRDFDWENRDWDRNIIPDWEQRLNPTRSYPSGYERDPYRNFNRGIGDDRQWERGYNRGQGYDRDWDREFNRRQGYNRDWDQGEYNRSAFNRGGLDRLGPARSYDLDWQRGGYNRGFDRGWESDVTDDFDLEPGTTWTYQETWWIVPGPFTGVGPRGYQRTDERILEDVNERLTQYGQIDASNISVGVSGGVVLLQGFVNSRRDKRIAEDIAESVSGVLDIDNQLRVQGASQWRSGAGGLRSQLREGMEVVDSNGQHIGTVKAVREDHLIVDRPVGQDLPIPFGAASFTADRVQLNVPADQVENLAQRAAEKLETPAPRERR